MKTPSPGGLAAAAAALFIAAACSPAAAMAAQRAIVHPQLWPSVRPQLPADPALERKVNVLLGEMTLGQKVGQLIQGDIGSVTPADLRQYPLGAILNGGNSKPGGNTLAPPSAWLTLTNQFYLASMAPAHGPHPIPDLWGIDAVHGNN
ncbi:MAG: hypothetical protein ACRETZ_07055, partial [Steroidobacteraceae bacterium]